MSIHDGLLRKIEWKNARDALTMTDDDVVYVMQWCQAINAKVIVRGDVIHAIDKSTRRPIGGIEIKRRIEAALTAR